MNERRSLGPAREELWPLLHPEVLDLTNPAVWRPSFRRPSRSPLLRFVASVLIRVMVISSLPSQVQAWVLLFPVSVLWPVVNAGRLERVNGQRNEQKVASGGTDIRADFPPEASSLSCAVSMQGRGRADGRGTFTCTCTAPRPAVWGWRAAAAHSVRLSMFDRAGNPGLIDGSFVVDSTAPVASFVAPGADIFINNTRPEIRLSYDDGAGTGVDPASVKVFLRSNADPERDVTAWFTAGSSEAVGRPPVGESLPDGDHVLRAELQDRAGNAAAAQRTFGVDTVPPTFELLEPPANSYLPTATPSVRVTYTDDRSGVDAPRLEFGIDGVDLVARLSVGPAEAAGALRVADALADGPHSAFVTVYDRAGNASLQPVPHTFIVDVTPPSLTIAQPAHESRHGTTSVEAVVTYADAQGLDLDSFTATLDGVPLSFGQGPAEALATLGPLPDEWHTLAVQIQDRAGNTTDASSTFLVDTTAPSLQVVQPQAGSILNTSSPAARVEYSDADALDLPTFVARVNGTDSTAAFTLQPEAATGTLATLPEGTSTLEAQIQDLTGNTGSASSSFLIDTLPPQGTFTSPGAITNKTQPTVAFAYADPGTEPSGVDPGALRVFLDGADRSALFAVGSGVVTGVPDAPLAEGVHEARLLMADRAGNSGLVEGSFTVDSMPPMASFVVPAANAFINNSPE